MLYIYLAHVRAKERGASIAAAAAAAAARAPLTTPTRLLATSRIGSD